MSGNKTLSREELKALILDKRNDPDVGAWPYRERKDFVDDINHPIREHMRERDKLINQGLKEYDLREDDFTEPGWDMGMDE